MTVPSEHEIREAFAAQLRARLRQRFRGKLPSAAIVAREFNLRANGVLPISQESTRRWIRGNSIPDAPRLAVLAAWLNLDFNAALGPAPEVLQTDPGGNHDEDCCAECADLKRLLCRRIGCFDEERIRFLWKMIHLVETQSPAALLSIV